jgi:hypothetical protein
MNPDQLSGAPEELDPEAPPVATEQAEVQDIPQLPFSLDDVDENFTLTGDQAKAWLRSRQAQLQAPLTRRQQEIAVEREQLAALSELQARLAADDTKIEALQELAELAGIEIDFDDDGDDEPEDQFADPLEAEVATLRAWKEEQEALKASAEQTSAQQDAEARFNQNAITQMERIASSLGTTLDDMPAEDKADIVQRALVAPKLPDGMPDFDAGLAAHLAYREHIANLEKAKYAASKQAMNPGISGGSGTRVTNLRDTQARIAAATAAADKHYIR